MKLPNFVSHGLGANEKVETRANSCQVANWDVLSSRADAGVSGMAAANNSTLPGFAVLWYLIKAGK